MSTAGREFANMHRMQRGHRDSVLLFGSAARGDATQFSDLDVLLVRADVESAHHSAETRDLGASCLVRSLSWLRRQAAEGTLFALHLQREGRILRDPVGLLDAFQRSAVRVDFGLRLEQLRQSLRVLDAPDLQPRCPGVRSVARHLLRTAVFLRSAEAGSITFSHQQACTAIGAPQLLPVLDGRSSASTVSAMRAGIRALLGSPIPAPSRLADLAELPHSGSLARQLLRGLSTVVYDPDPDTASLRTAA